MSPVVSEVVDVDEPLIDFQAEIRESKRGGVFGFGLAVWPLESTVAYFEGIKVAIEPGEDELQHVVQLMKSVVLRDSHSPPDGRFDVLERDVKHDLALLRRLRAGAERAAGGDRPWRPSWHLR